MLRQWNVRYLIVDVTSAREPGLPAALAVKGLRPVTVRGNVEVFEVPGGYGTAEHPGGARRADGRHGP